MSVYSVLGGVPELCEQDSALLHGAGILGVVETRVKVGALEEDGEAVLVSGQERSLWEPSCWERAKRPEEVIKGQREAPRS